MKNFKSIFKALSVLAVFSSVFIVACEKQNDVPTNEVNSSVVELNQGKYDQDMVDFAKSLAASMKNKDMRAAIKQEASKQFDEDYDILWANFKDDNVSGTTVEKLISSKAEIGTTSLRFVQDRLPLLNIAVPVNSDKWNTDNFTPLVAVIPSGVKDKDIKQIKAYDAEGKEFMLDAQKRPDYPVVVIGNNERVTFSETKGYILSKGFKQEAANILEDVIPVDEDGSGGGGYIPPGTPSYCVNYGTRLGIGAFRTDDITAIEGWFRGAPEIMVSITAANGPNNAQGTLVTDGVTNVPSRSIIDGKWYVPAIPNYKFYWQTAYGDLLTVELSEQDSDEGSWLNQTLEVVFADKKYSTNVLRFLHNSHDYVGKFQVSRQSCMPDENGVSQLYFRMVTTN
jgi:Protein of unknown function (DUF3103)